MKSVTEEDIGKVWQKTLLGDVDDSTVDKELRLQQNAAGDAMRADVARMRKDFGAALLPERIHHWVVMDDDLHEAGHPEITLQEALDEVMEKTTEEDEEDKEKFIRVTHLAAQQAGTIFHEYMAQQGANYTDIAG